MQQTAHGVQMGQLNPLSLRRYARLKRCTHASVWAKSECGGVEPSGAFLMLLWTIIDTGLAHASGVCQTCHQHS